MGNRYKLLDETREYDGQTLRRIYWIKEDRKGGWIGENAKLPQDTDAEIYGDALIIGGIFLDGTFEGGIFRGGIFGGGTFQGGTFEGGTFLDGIFLDGIFQGGIFRGGEFYGSPSCAQRSDGYMFVAKIVEGDLRIWAGCRNFPWDRAVDHWSGDHPHGEESTLIIHFLKKQAEREELRRLDIIGKKGEAA